MNLAHAAETAAEGGHVEAWYSTPEFWVAIAFVLLFALAGKKVLVLVGTALDDRAETIRKRLDEATALREEAQALLAANQRQQRETASAAETIIARAKGEAERVRARAEKDLSAALDRRRKMAEDRIAQVEARAIAEVRAAATEVALQATRQILAETVTGKKADALVDQAIKELETRLH